MWLNHKKLCKTVSKLVQGVTAATEGLVLEFGSVKAFLESEKVRSGAWDWPNTDDPALQNPLSLNTTDRYIRYDRFQCFSLRMSSFVILALFWVFSPKFESLRQMIQFFKRFLYLCIGEKVFLN